MSDLVNGKIGGNPYFFILDCRKDGITSSFSFFTDLAKKLFMSNSLTVLGVFGIGKLLELILSV